MGDLQVDANDMTISNSVLNGELNGITAATKLFSVSPFGILLTGARITIEDSVLSGHESTGKYASSDVIQQPVGLGKTSVTLINTQLKSSHTIIFGYPLNGDSYIRVLNETGDGPNASTLYRYDTHHGPSCNLDAAQMAMVCQENGS
jgi:hypothetical protein